ncbi:MAG: alpha-L-fucosidase [Victivallales bacterium]
MTPAEFSELRYGMFIHFGLFSKLARGEWVMNREQIPIAEMKKVAAEFNPVRFDADEICQLAVDGGMKYIVFTTMHHEGFRMYETALSEFNSVKCCHRDFTKEIIASAKRHGLKIGLYHSLNNWYDSPDAVDALENKAKYELFIEHTFARLKELVIRFNPVDVLWYDGWWPFHYDGWQAERMNRELREIQPHLLFNGRNGLAGDFGTPEQHLTAPVPWRPWEACMTLNNHWGYHCSDNNWKTPIDVINMLLTCSTGRGNLLLNIGPRGDGSIPERSAEIVLTVGKWIKDEGGQELLVGTDKLSFSPTIPDPADRGDWDLQGKFAASGNNLYMVLEYNPGRQYTFCGLNSKVQSVTACGKTLLSFTQNNDKITVELPKFLENMCAPVLKFACDRKPAVYRSGGMRIPKCEHLRYDPKEPDIQYEK